jgi:hypothetical protein
MFLFVISACHSVVKIPVAVRNSVITGSEFYKHASAMNWKERDSVVVKEILSGNIPAFFKRFVPVILKGVDSSSGKSIHITYYVSPDYLSVGSDKDWARVNITPMAAQKIADQLHCFLPTRKMVDDIYKNAIIKPEPVPMYGFRDSTPTMYQHHLIIEGQRKNKKGLIAGIKKDVVISGKISRDPKPNRVAIYGWHKQDGKPIQPLYTGHVNWYVDYSQGIRLVYQKIKVNNKWVDYTDLLKEKGLKHFLCDEEWCDFFRYDY